MVLSNKPNIMESIVHGPSCVQFSFEWISQLRYYWEVDDRQQENMWVGSAAPVRLAKWPGRALSRHAPLEVKCVQTSFPYGRCPVAQLRREREGRVNES